MATFMVNRRLQEVQTTSNNISFFEGKKQKNTRYNGDLADFFVWKLRSAERPWPKAYVNYPSSLTTVRKAKQNPKSVESTTSRKKTIATLKNKRNYTILYHSLSPFVISCGRPKRLSMCWKAPLYIKELGCPFISAAWDRDTVASAWVHLALPECLEIQSFLAKHHQKETHKKHSFWVATASPRCKQATSNIFTSSLFKRARIPAEANVLTFNHFGGCHSDPIQAFTAWRPNGRGCGLFFFWKASVSGRGESLSESELHPKKQLERCISYQHHLMSLSYLLYRNNTLLLVSRLADWLWCRHTLKIPMYL